MKKVYFIIFIVLLILCCLVIGLKFKTVQDITEAELNTTPIATEAPATPTPTPEPTATPDPDIELWATMEAYSNRTKEEIQQSTIDNYLWMDGYLYCLDEQGNFLRDTYYNNLYFGADARYTSGNAELDKYVADTLNKYITLEFPRIDILRTVYDHVKNDFSYLTRNYYESGEEGWDINEALTLFSTGKGNCYCYAGAYCALCRGLGYDARTWSGTMGVEDQQHAWTEITIDGTIYISDPELEMNYWYLQMYQDFFLIPKEDSAGYNYKALGRDDVS